MKDMSNITGLLYVLHKTVGSPKLKAIHDAAEAALVELAGKMGKVPADADLVRTASAPVNTSPSVRPSTAKDAEPPIFPEDSGVVERKI